MGISRRQALLAALGGSAAGCVGGGNRTRFVSAASGRDGRHWLAGFDASGNLVFQAPLPGRGHEAVVAPDRTLAFVPARRAGKWAAVVDLRDGRVVDERRATPGRHFYGHGVFSPDGGQIITPENDFEHGIGVMVVRDARSLDVVGEFPSGGIGPHEVQWLRTDVLAVANGGIRTHPGQPRKKLNVDTMRPNLALLDTRAGAVVERVAPPNHQAGIRHMDVARGRLVLATQYEGSPTDDVPLVYLFDATTGELKALPAPEDIQRRMRQYVASICVDPDTNRAMATAPHGHLVTYWDLNEGCVGHRRVRDAGGVAFDHRAGEFVVTNGAGAAMRFDSAAGTRQGPVRRFPGLRWDNHLTAV